MAESGSEIKVWKVGNNAEAKVVQGLLDSYGIASCIVSGKSDGRFLFSFFLRWPGMGESWITVAREDEAEARDILEAHLSATDREAPPE